MSDAIIVFGGGVDPDGTLHASSRTRVETAVALWRGHLAPLIVLSGAWSFSLPTPPATTEAAAMAAYAESLGCPPDALLREEQSKDTIGNAFYVKTLFALPRGWKELTIVAAEHHLPRVQHICERIFGPGYILQYAGAPLPMTDTERHEADIRERASQSLFDELFTVPVGDHVAIEHLLMTLHPGYAAHPQYSVADIGRIIEARRAKLRAGEAI